MAGLLLLIHAYFNSEGWVQDYPAGWDPGDH